jgi:hypothetical protein
VEDNFAIEYVVNLIVLSSWGIFLSTTIEENDMKHSKIGFSNLKFCSQLLLITLTITNLGITVAKADGGSDDDDSSDIINFDQSFSQESLEQNNKQHFEAGINRYFPEVRDSQLNQLTCYLKTDDGRILDLREICVQESEKK